MLFAISILQVLLWALGLSRHYKEKIYVSLPLVVGADLLVLYLLSLFRSCNYISWFFVGSIFVFAIWQYFFESHENLPNDCKEIVIDEVFGAELFAIISGGILLAGRSFRYFDDFNFWAVDLKSIYAWNGMAPSGLNCAPGFGDYPPLMQLAGYWICRAFGRFDSGLTMSAYFILLILFITPVFKHFHKRFIIPIIILLLSFGSWSSEMLKSHAPDVIMAVAFGYCLILTYDYKYTKKKYLLICISVACSCLPLIKTVGIQWSAMVLLFAIILGALSIKETLITAILPLVFTVSWWRFCKINGRSTYITNALSNYLQHGVNNEELVSKRADLIRVFIKAITSPFNKDNGAVASLSYVGFLIILICVVILIKHRYSKRIIVWLAGTFLVETAVLLYSVTTLFIEEYSNYSVVEHQILLIRRYGSPVLIGNTMLVMFVFLENTSKEGAFLNKKVASIILTVVLAVITPWAEVYTDYIGYRYKDDLVKNPDAYYLSNQTFGNCSNMVLYAQLISETGDKQKKVLVAMNEANSSNSYILQYLCAPVPLDAAHIWYEGESLEMYIRLAKANGCAQLFFCGYEDEDEVPLAEATIKADMIYDVEELEAIISNE